MFKKIFSFFDRRLITPITKGILKVMDFFRNNGRGIEKLVSKKQSLIVISLIFAFAVFLIIDNESNTLTDQYAEILYNQKVTAIYNEEAYVVEGLPKTVDITLIGKKRHIFLAKQAPSKDVSVDLTGLKPGNYEVDLKYSQQIKALDYKLDPSTASIAIYEKVSETRSLTVDILHQDNLDSKLFIKNVELNRADAIIKGAEHRLKEVATVKALVDVDNITKPEVGELTLTDVPLVAYDTDGKVVDVEIVPNKVEAKVSITSPNKQVPIRVVPTGNLAFGKAIKTLTTNINNVVVYGDEEVINKLEYIPVEINVDNLDKDKEYHVNISKPKGVRDISTKTVVIKVTLDGLSTKEFKDINITTENLASKFKVQALTENDSKVDVIVRGSQSVIDSLDATTLNDYIDLKDYGVGEYEVTVYVTGSDLRLTYVPRTEKVKVRITEK